MKGILLVDKPAGWTSHDVVARVRSVANIRRIGHTGTLDPAATGLLVLCLGQATRLCEFLTGVDKTYVGTLQLGLRTDSYDLDGAVLDESPVPNTSADEIQAFFNEMTGDIMQVPPMVSAVKIGGERLYKKARKGETVERPPRPVSVLEFTLTGLDLPHVYFRVRCGSGTYVRSLCHELGEKLGCGATLAALCRTVVGRFSLKDAVTIEDLQEPTDVAARLRSMDDILDLPAIVVSESARACVAAGGPLGAAHLAGPVPDEHGMVQLKAEDGELLAIAHIDSPKGVHESLLEIKPKKVFCVPA